jgi:hypothetical protein
MNLIEWLGVVSAIVSILAFLFAVWVWLKSNVKTKELEGVIQSVYDVSGTIIWDMQVLHSEDPATRLRNAEKSLGLVSALHTMTGKYAGSDATLQETELGTLLQRGVIWNNRMITELERSERVREVWLVMPDLEPDLSDPRTGRIVANNLKSGKRYVYFCPSDLAELQVEQTRLLANIGALKSPRQASRVTIVPIDPEVHGRVFQRGNTILFFSENSDWTAGTAFEEVIFTQISARGLFWQEYTPAVAAEIQSALKKELQVWRRTFSHKAVML